MSTVVVTAGARPSAGQAMNGGKVHHLRVGLMDQLAGQPPEFATEKARILSS